MNFYFQKWRSPVGNLYLAASETHLHAVVFEKQWPAVRKQFEGLIEKETPLIARAKEQLMQYFEGARRCFELPLALNGTDFQKQVWTSLAEIPFGSTRTYGQQAAALNAPGAARAVGRTNGRNPLCIVLPCHRVVGAGGKLTGYAGGLEIKKFLLKHEGAAVA